MPADVISLADRREAAQPHMQGAARCIQCRHEWQAVVPVGTVALECPACSLMKGALVNMCMPADGEVRECQCGNDLFVVERSGILCARCGTRQLFEDCYP